MAAGFTGQAMLIIAIERGLGHGPAGDAVDEIDGLLAYPVDGNDFDGLAGYDALNDSPVFQVLENSHFEFPMDQARPCSWAMTHPAISLFRNRQETSVVSRGILYSASRP